MAANVQLQITRTCNKDCRCCTVHPGIYRRPLAGHAGKCEGPRPRHGVVTLGPAVCTALADRTELRCAPRTSALRRLGSSDIDVDHRCRRHCSRNLDRLEVRERLAPVRDDHREQRNHDRDDRIRYGQRRDRFEMAGDSIERMQVQTLRSGSEPTMMLNGQPALADRELPRQLA